MAKRAQPQTQNRVNPCGRKVPSKYRRSDSHDATDGRGLISKRGITGAESKSNGQDSTLFMIENSIHQEESMSRPGSAFSVYRPLPEIGQKWSKTSSDVLDNVIQHVSSLQIQKDHSPHVKKKKQTEEPTSLEYDNYNVENNVFQDFNITKPNSPNAKIKKHASSSTIRNLEQNERHTGMQPRKITRREMRSIQLQRRRSSQMNLVPQEPSEGVERLLIALRLPGGERIQRFFSPNNAIKDVVAFAESQVKESLAHCDVFESSVPKKKLLNLKSSIRDCGIQDRTLLLLEEQDEEENDDTG
ncbi:uncharacterized protein LOC117109462 [Anneissia japonica]|uniref:uncharacterized protein LOC117109462 n=1 Tax=Anneissia japonica TaxID=1529436 RepID=UPI0014257FEA|nr:uncharacterized protein LOC117109462 [Anneissia japonica]XP_033107717.1 uncharacterized protein LOC117109462 [Anneissia japonica]